MSTLTIDTHEFTRLGQQAEGVLAITDLPRLDATRAGEATPLHWSLQGESLLGPDGSRTALLRLNVQTRLEVACVRCLEPVWVELDLIRPYRLVGSEAQAEQEDAEDDEVDVLVASRSFDLAGLIEDEAIMALPLAPRHSHCTLPASLPADPPPAAAAVSLDSPDRPLPFAALEKLKSRGSQ